MAIACKLIVAFSVLELYISILCNTALFMQYNKDVFNAAAAMN